METVTEGYGVINTADKYYGLVHDAAKPWAVITFRKGKFGQNIGVNTVISRHETYKGACISGGKRWKRSKAEGAQ